MVDFDIAMTLAVTSITVALFISERLALSTVAMLALVTLLLSGVIGPEEAFAGFANRATVSVGAIFVLSAGLQRTGAIDALGKVIVAMLRRHWRAGLAGLMLMTSTLSAFINNTAVVSVFLPLLVQVARECKVSASRLLMPMSFASILGGTNTTIGTSTNLLVSAMLIDHGLDGLGLVELAPLGLIFVGVGCAYMVLIGSRLLPERRPVLALADDFAVRSYVTDVELTEGSPMVGATLGETRLIQELDADVLAVFRGELESAMPRDTLVLAAGDVLRLRCPLDRIAPICDREALRIITPDIAEREDGGGETAMVEAVVSGQALFANRSLRDARLDETYNAIPLAIRHRGRLSRDRLSDIVVRPGDALLLEIDRDQLPELRRSPAFVLVSEPSFSRTRRERWPIAVLILVAVIASAAIGLLPIVAAVSTGALLMVLSGCLRHDEAIAAIDWNLIFLLAGVLAIGAAMESSGTAALIGRGLVDGVGELGPHVVLSAVFFASAALSAFMSNNGTAVLFVPIAFAAAGALQVDPRPLVVAVAFGASTSFATPVGYQTNALVYSAGQYRFMDFVKIGGPLTLIFWLVATFAIPIIWPL